MAAEPRPRRWPRCGRSTTSGSTSAPASLAQSRAVVDVLRALVEFYAEHPARAGAEPAPSAPGDEAVRAAVAYVAGMTDRYAFDTAVDRAGLGPDPAAARQLTVEQRRPTDGRRALSRPRVATRSGWMLSVPPRCCPLPDCAGSKVNRRPGSQGVTSQAASRRPGRRGIPHRYGDRGRLGLGRAARPVRQQGEPRAPTTAAHRARRDRAWRPTYGCCRTDAPPSTASALPCSCGASTSAPRCRIATSRQPSITPSGETSASVGPTRCPSCVRSVLLPLPALVAARHELGLVDLVVAGEWLVRQGRATVPEVSAALAAAQGRDCRVARRAGALVRDGSESPQESRLRLLMVLAGLPEPETNVDLGDEWFFIGRVDLYLRAWNVAVEYEGDQHRTDPRIFAKDLEALRGARRVGCTGRRVAKDHLRRPREVVSRIHSALVSRGYDGPPPVFGQRWREAFER